MSDPDAPPLPNERFARPAVVKLGCVMACGLALLLALYFGFFFFLILDDVF